MTDPPVKVCRRCGTLLPPTPGYSFSLKRWCTACQKLRNHESSARSREKYRIGRGLGPNVNKPCVRCGKVMNLKPSTAKVRKYCGECRLIVDKEKMKISSARGLSREPVRIINCADCGKEMLVIYKTQVRCHDCKIIRCKIFTAVRALRSAVYNKAIVNPADARKLVVDMIAEDGLDFKQFAIDGIVEKVIVDRRTLDKYKGKEAT